jgi:small-conductance mechanosensitive channel
METSIQRWLYDPAVGKLITVSVGILVVYLLARVLLRAVAGKIKDSDTRYRVRKAISFFAYLVGVFLVAAVLSDQLGSLTVALGVAGAGIAFALQEVIASVAGWVAVSFGRFYRTGDRVKLGGIMGDVIDIAVLRTTLMECGQWVNGDLYNGRIVRVANSFVFKEPVVNYSADFPFLWDEIVVPIRHGCDPEMTRQLIARVAEQVVGEFASGAAAGWQEVARRYRIEEARVSPMVTLAADENWLSFTLRYVVDYRARRSTKDALWSRLLAEIATTEGKVVIASASFVVETPGVNVRLVDNVNTT